MKKTILAAFAALLLCGLFSPELARAQPTICTDVAPQDMISDFANWDWTIERTNPLYCRTWAIRTGSNSMGKVYGAPWHAPQNGVMNRIATEKDYTRDKGWELLRMDLGGKTIVDVPYFILYNRYTSVIRTFFRLDNSMSTYNSGAVITMSHVDGTWVTPTNSLASTPLLTPDKYQNQAQTNQVVSYVAKMSTQNGWIVGEFNMAFDPYFRDARYLGSALQFQVYGTVKNEIELEGTANFLTNTEEGFAIAGEKNGANGVIQDTQSSTGAGLKKFVAKGKKILGSVKPEDGDKFMQNALNASLKLASSKNTGTSNLGLTLANTFRAGGGLAKTMKTVLGFASSASGALGIVGSLIGAIWPDEAASKPSFTPTVTKGSIALKGSITTSYPLRGVICQIPGTLHSSDGSTMPYYDNALGLFNIKRALAVNKISYTLPGGTNLACPLGPNGGPYARPVEDYYDSYQVQADLEGVYNQAAGLELVSAEAALISEVPTTLKAIGDFNGQNGVLVPVTTPADLNNLTFPWPAGGPACYTLKNDNYISAALSGGIVQQTRMDNGEADEANEPTILQTPFVSFGCMRNLTFTTVGGAKVYLRVKVVLRASNASQAQPLIYYVQDYELAVTNGGTPNNPAYRVSNNNQQPPFTNLPSPISTTGPSQVTVSGTYTTPTTIQSIDNITSSTSVATSFTTSSSRSQLLAGNSIVLNGGFSVEPGTEFVAAIGLLSQLSCGANVISGNTYAWSYNNAAYRQALATRSTALESKIELFPNPTSGAFSLLVQGYEGPATVTLLNTLGRKQFSKTVILKNQVEAKIATNLAAGVYLVQIATAEGTMTKKLLVH